MPSLSAYAVFLATALAILLVPGPAVLYVVTRSIEMGRAGGDRLGRRDHDRDGHVRRPRHGRTLLARHRLGRGVRRREVRGLRRISSSSACAGCSDAASTRRRRNPCPRTRRRAYSQGFLVNLTNPKMIVFVFALLPQFVDPNASRPWLQTLVLGLSFTVLAFLSDCAYALAAGSARRADARHEHDRVGAALGRRLGARRARPSLGRVEPEPVTAVQFVDCRWELGGPQRWAGELYLAGHVPGASFLDVDEDLSDLSAGDGAGPAPAPLGGALRGRRPPCGDRSRDVTVVAYGTLGGAERLWWLLRHFGHDDCAVLIGGIDAWGGPLRAGPEEVEPVVFVPRLRFGDTISAEDLAARLGDRRSFSSMRALRIAGAASPT